jgi:anti-sigma B factor antagonist
MGNESANLSVWVGDQLICIRIAGRASFQCSVDFKTLVNTLRQKGHSRFVLDLASCQLMDSTFLGVMAGLGLKFQEVNGEKPATIELWNPSPRISDLLENLGIGHLFKVVRGDLPELEGLRQVDPVACDVDRKETTRTCLEAHRTLMEVNPANVGKFKDVARFLEEDLKKMEAR